MNFQTSFYSAVYDRFLVTQPEGFRVVRLIYPGNEIVVPELTADSKSALVILPKIRLSNNQIRYGSCKFNDDLFGAASGARMILASASLVGTKAIFYWLYREHIAKWLKSKRDNIRANYAVNCILDTFARRRIKKIAGNGFYKKVVSVSDILSFCTLHEIPSDLVGLAMRQLTASLISDQWGSLRIYGKISDSVGSFFGKLSTLPEPSQDDLSMICQRKMDKGHDSGEKWELEGLADGLYSILLAIPGRWPDSYLSYSNALDRQYITPRKGGQSVISLQDFERAKKLLNIDAGGSENVFQELFHLMLREEKAEAAILNKFARASPKVNFDSYEFPEKDYTSYLSLHSKMSKDIRLMIQRANVVKNVSDESQFQESGRIDLQIAIQAIASGKQRDDMFVRDEDLLKSEAWTILIDSSKSLQGSSETLKAAAICLAETAKEVMGSRRWGMFAFSDKLQIIKYYDETYDRDAQARIGGLRQDGLSHIPDAMRTVHSTATDFLKEKNYIILVSDGIPSGYVGIEAEFSKSVREAGRIGAQVGAISLSGNRVRGTVRKSKEVQEQSDIVKAFIDIYNEMSQ